MIEQINLADKKWKFHLSAEKPDISAAFDDEITLPSTVSQMKRSPVTDERSDGYLTDPHAFEGYALYRRTADVSEKEGTELFLVLERTRTSTLWIDGRLVGTQNSLCAAHRYDITGLCHEGMEITVMIDNVSCPVPGGHMTSKDTQTNWLGITGRICIERRSSVRLEKIKLFPDYKTSTVTVKADLIGKNADVIVSADGFESKCYSLTEGSNEFSYRMDGAKLWNEHSPVTYTLKLACGDDVSEVTFGMRNFETRGKDFLLNGKKIYLRGKHDGMIFPMTGAAPTDTEGWLKVMKAAKEHGINHYRFHTCCPPDAAFTAADMLGIYMEPELPFWGTVDEEVTPAQQYLIEEGFRMLDSFANHPSYFGMSMGNELWGSKERLNEILGGYKAYDPRPLYTQGSNNFQFWPCIVDNDDFFVGVRFSRERLFRGSYAMCDAPLGHIQTDAPNADYNYDAHISPKSVSGAKSEGGTIEIQYGTGVKTVSLDNGSGEFVSNVPVVSHEVGQYFMYPDYNEIEKYTGVLKPYNLEIFRERLEKAGLSELSDKYFRASGRFAAECYKAEIETALRSKELSGFQLLDIQDFTGQGTALVGVLNSFMESKGVISPEEWRSFCSDKVVLACLPKFVFAAGEELDVPVMLYNYSDKAASDPETVIAVGGKEYSFTTEGSFENGVYDMGSVKVKMPEVTSAVKTVMTVTCDGAENSYDLWIFPEAVRNGDAFITDDWTKAKDELSKGGKVLFIPGKIKEEKSVEGTYCTDFWNYPMFRSISESMNKAVPVGTLGLLINKEHKALSGFPTENYSTAQWYDIVTGSRTAILDGTGIDPIVRTMDNCERNHNLGTVFEAEVNGGKLLVCTSPVDKSDALPCRQLLASLAEYVSSDDFAPVQTIDTAVLDELFII